MKIAKAKETMITKTRIILIVINKMFLLSTQVDNYTNSLKNKAIIEAIDLLI